jgi:hypothetical protein
MLVVYEIVLGEGTNDATGLLLFMDGRNGMSG